MTRFIILFLVTLVLSSCGVKMEWQDFLRRLSVLDFKKPELMTAGERDAYTSIAFERSASSKLISAQTGSNISLNPGTYIVNNPPFQLSFTDFTGQIWTVERAGSFSLKRPQNFLAVGGSVNLLYSPIQTDYGVPLRIVVNENAGDLTINIPFGGTGSAIETTAAGVFVRNLVLNGPSLAVYTAAAGNSLNISYNAFL